jgi:hypothetical protein
VLPARTSQSLPRDRFLPVEAISRKNDPLRSREHATPARALDTLVDDHGYSRSRTRSARCADAPCSPAALVVGHAVLDIAGRADATDRRTHGARSLRHIRCKAVRTLAPRSPRRLSGRNWTLRLGAFMLGSAGPRHPLERRVRSANSGPHPPLPQACSHGLPTPLPGSPSGGPRLPGDWWKMAPNETGGDTPRARSSPAAPLL